VDSGDGAFLRINEKYGNAVGGLHGEEQACSIRDGSVAAAGFAGRGFECVNDIGVKLFEGCQCEIVRTERGLEAAAVFHDVFAGIPVGVTEIQDFFVFKIADAAGTSAERVGQPGKFYESGHLEDSNAADVALAPVAGGRFGAARFACGWVFLQRFRERHGDASIISVV